MFLRLSLRIFYKIQSLHWRLQRFLYGYVYVNNTIEDRKIDSGRVYAYYRSYCYFFQKQRSTHLIVCHTVLGGSLSNVFGYGWWLQCGTNKRAITPQNMHIHPSPICSIFDRIVYIRIRIWNDVTTHFWPSNFNRKSVEIFNKHLSDCVD